MTVFPIVGRELRSSARQSATYHLRLCGAGAAVAATFFFAYWHGLGENGGGALFGHLHLTLFCAIWIFVPFLTADCISRERREGTLGLLCLARLRADAIVLAKSLAHGLRALTLWLAVVPALMLPVLLGGVSWGQATVSALVNLSAICLALAAGVISSSLSRSWTRVLVFAAGISLCFALLLVTAHGSLVAANVSSLPISFARPYARRFELFLGEGFWLVMGWGAVWPRLLALGGAPIQKQWLLGSAETAGVAVLGLFLAVRFAAWRVKQVWQEEPPSARVVWFEEKLCKPVFFLPLLRRWMQHKLQRNPVGWLEQRSWSGRLTGWAWLALVTGLCLVAVKDPRALVDQAFLDPVAAWLLAGSMALSAAGSFRRERETGVLELLLVSPMGERAILLGRLRGLYAQFLPATALLLGVWAYLSATFSQPSMIGYYYGSPYYQSRAWPLVASGAYLFCASSFWCVPVIGLYFSLRCRSAVVAFLQTILVGLVAPHVLGGMCKTFWLMYTGWFQPNGTPSGPGFWAIGGQLLAAALCWRGLLSLLQRRAFAVERETR